MFINIKNKSINSKDIQMVNSYRSDDCYVISISISNKLFPLKICSYKYNEYLRYMVSLEEALRCELYKLDKFTDTLVK